MARARSRQSDAGEAARRALGDGGKIEEHQSQRRGASSGGDQEAAIPAADVEQAAMPRQVDGVEDLAGDERLRCRHQVRVARGCSPLTELGSLAPAYGQ